jgi:carboxyl-terminal processing protease
MRKGPKAGMRFPMTRQSFATVRRSGWHFELRAGMLSIAMLLFLIAACASSNDEGRFGGDPARSLFADAYQSIHDYYLEPITIETIALSGLHKLDAPDGSLVIQDDGALVRFLSYGAEIDRRAQPAANDAGGWAAVTSAALTMARAHEPTLASATDEQLYKQVFGGVLEKLDRFSRYAGYDAARDQRAARDGYVGVGISLGITDSRARIASVVADSPAQIEGIEPDDNLIAIDGRPVARLPLDRITKLLHGRAGTTVTITIERPPEGRTHTVKLTRALVVLPTVTAERDGAIAVFHVATFNHSTAESLAAEIDRLGATRGKTVKGIVLDLRGNPGGLLDQAVEVAELFLDRGAILSTRGRHTGAAQYYEATETDRTHGLPMVVLVNGGTASSSEIVAAALQDNGRAVVIGSASFGKGTVQRVQTLPNDGELTLTWAKLVTPAGYILHQHGVIPTFCTSPPVETPEATEDTAARIARILDRGTHPASGIENEPRSALSDADWTALRDACPAESAAPPLDLKLAKQVLSNPALYAQALSRPGVNIAHAEPRAAGSALQ